MENYEEINEAMSTYLCPPTYMMGFNREAYLQARHPIVHAAGLLSARADAEDIVNIMPGRSRNALFVLIPCGIPPKTSASTLTSDSTSQPMPVHWTNEFPGVRPCFGYILKLTFTVLVIISFGRTSLHQKWKKIHSSEEDFTELMDRIVARTSTITVVASLLLSCVVALITTAPPEGAPIDYNQRGPYLCLWAALGILLGGVIVGSADIYVLSTCSQGWMRKTMMATRARLMSALIFLAYPFLAIGCATLVCVFGLLIACWVSQDRVVQIIGSVLLLVPASLVFPFVCTQLVILSERSPQQDTENV